MNANAAAVAEAYGDNMEDSVLGPILMRSATPPPSDKVSQFLATIHRAGGGGKPESNYGSEFDHISGEDNTHGDALATPLGTTARDLNLYGGNRTVIPHDAEEINGLNQELFGNGTEASYMDAPHGVGVSSPRGIATHAAAAIEEADGDNDSVDSNEQEMPTTPKSKSTTLKPGFRQDKVIDSMESWGNAGPLPNSNRPSRSQFPETPAWAAQHALPSPNGQTPMTPFISIQPPTDPQKSRSASRVAPSESGRSKASRASHAKSKVTGGEGAERSSRTESIADTEKPHTVRSPTVKTHSERPPTEASRSRAPSRAGQSQRAFSPARTERSNAQRTIMEQLTSGAPDMPGATPSRMPLPMSPTRSTATSRQVPLQFGAPPSRASPSKAGSVRTAHTIQKSVARSRAPTEAAGSIRTEESHDASAAPANNVEDMLRSHRGGSGASTVSYASQTGPQSRPIPSKAASVRTHRTGEGSAAPPITISPSRAPSLAPSRAPSRAATQRTERTEKTANTQKSVKTHKTGASEVKTASRAPSRLSKSQHQADEDDDEEDDDENDDARTTTRTDARTENTSKHLVRREVTDIDLTKTPKTAYTMMTAHSAIHQHAESALSRFHDEELCVLLHAADNDQSDVVKTVLKKGVAERLRTLNRSYEEELRTARKHHAQGLHRHRALKSVNGDDTEAPPKWAEPLFDLLRLQQAHIERLEDASRNSSRQSNKPPAVIDLMTNSDDNEEEGTVRGAGEDDYPNTPHMTVPIDTQTPRADEEDLYEDEEDDDFEPTDGGETRSKAPTHYDEGEDDLDSAYDNRPRISKPEMYRLKMRGATPDDPEHGAWRIEPQTNPTVTANLPEIPGSEYMDDGPAPIHHEVIDTRPYEVGNSPPLPPLPLDVTGQPIAPQHTAQHWPASDWPVQRVSTTPSWQHVYQRLLNWALVWSNNELKRALESTLPGHAVDEVALTIWLTQTYKRYVRTKHVEHPPGRVDRLFVPPNVAEAINTAVFHGRHGDAKTMLRDLWAPFGFEGMPRLLIVLAKHRKSDDHYVVHRYALPEGSLTTYDTRVEKTLNDGRPLGWWFAIQAAWPNAMYPQLENVSQKIIRIHRPMQLPIDNSLAAAAIWRNLIMGSKAERTVDLPRLRELVNSEVRGLMQRKELGRLTVGGSKSQWAESA